MLQTTHVHNLPIFIRLFIMVQNRRIVLNSRPVSAPSEENFRFETREFDLSENSLSEGEISVKTIWVSIDPYLRAPLGSAGDSPRPAMYVANQFKDSTSMFPNKMRNTHILIMTLQALLTSEHCWAVGALARCSSPKIQKLHQVFFI
jgi:hypothetical protein